MNIHILVIIFLVICILVLDTCIYKLKSKIKILERKNEILDTCHAVQKNINSEYIFDSNTKRIETIYGRQRMNFPCSTELLHCLAREKLLEKVDTYIKYNDKEIDWISDGQTTYECTASLSVLTERIDSDD